MGTRSITFFEDEDRTKVAAMYRQFDGYPSGHGAELAEVLAPRGVGRYLVNGYCTKDAAQRAFNGIGCLAADVVKSLKSGIGGIYLRSPEDGTAWIDYIYTISHKDGESLPFVKVEDSAGVVLFEGDTEAFWRWIPTVPEP